MTRPLTGLTIQEELKAHRIGIQLFVPYNAKIADITHADTNLHTLTLANAAGTGAIAGETRKIISIYLKTLRIAGTGNFLRYPNEGTQYHYMIDGTTGPNNIIADNTQRLQYNLSVANDDWDLWCLGYVVEA